MSPTPSALKTQHHPAWASLATVACDDVERLLEHFFSSTDNLLYDLSKRASSNSEAAFYFDAMRELRLVRQAAIEHFLNNIKTQAARLSIGEVKTEKADQDLDLLSSDELDRALACETVINNVNTLYHDELTLLARRLAQLSPINALPVSQLPFSPEWLANNFSAVMPSLNGKTVVILFKQLEKHLLRQLAPLLSQCNEFLVSEGYCESMPQSAERKAVPKLADIKTSLDDPLPTISTPSEFTLPLYSLRQILANARYQAANDATLNYRFSFNPGPVVPLPILGAALTQQQFKTADLQQFPLKNQVSDYVSRALETDNKDEPNALNPYHEDIIQLVAAFFDELLEDNELTTVTQSLICRLQIPILKVALRNESFFTEADNSARRYINLLTDVAQTLDNLVQPDEDPLYSKMLDSVRRINKLFDIDEDIFASELDTLERLNDQEVKRAEIIEQRTRQAEEGRARFESAKNAAVECIQHYTSNLRLHRQTQQFINEYWQQVLVLTFLKEGQGPEWLTHGQTLNDLLWLDQEHTDERSIARATTILSSIKARLLVGLSSLHINEEQCNALCDKVIQATKENAERTPITHHGQTAIQRQKKQIAALEQHYFDMAKNMDLGTWLKYQDGSNLITCKLASNASADAFLFVNRLGMKKLSRSRKDVALDLQHGRAKIMQREPLFDSLMNRALSHLKPQTTL
ncbi:MAG TPA: DUF1631 family protein [Marinagarivorans sp.]